MKLEIAAHCHNYQKRLCWMLSSIHDNDFSTDCCFDIEITIAYLKGNGKPLTTEVIDYFDNCRPARVIYKKQEWDDLDKFKFRGLTRNRVIAESDADYILFADCDMVYPSNFFENMHALLSLEHSGCDKCMYGQRYSPESADTVEDIVNKYTYPIYIPDSYATIMGLPGELKANIGAGYCQLVRREAIINKNNGLYINPKRNPDQDWVAKFWKTKSDSVFRRKMGKQPIPLPIQGHVQHHRDKETGTHLEEQR